MHGSLDGQKEPLDALYDLYAKILFRKPDSSGFIRHLRSLLQGKKTLAEVESDLIKSSEWINCIKPVEEEVKGLYDLSLFRPPAKKEIIEHIVHFHHECGTNEKSLAAIQTRKIAPYLDIRPLSVEMDITNQCNLRCSMCFFSHPSIYGRKRMDLSVELFQRIASQIFPCTAKLCLSFSTEALIHRDFFEMVALAIEYRIPNIHISTNATLLTKEMSQKMVEVGFHAINISIDAATEHTFVRLRKGADFHRVIRNIRTLQRIKKMHGAYLPVLSCSFVMMKSNIHELPEFIHLAHNLDITDVHIMHMVPYKEIGSEEESLVNDWERCNAILAVARDRAASLHVNMIEPGDFHPGKPTFGGDLPRARRFDLPLDQEDRKRECCPFPWHFLGIHPNGDVIPCGWWFSNDPMGNIQTQSFEEIWKGERFMELRGNLSKRILPENCRICPSAGMGDVANPASFSVRRLY